MIAHACTPMCCFRFSLSAACVCSCVSGPPPQLLQARHLLRVHALHLHVAHSVTRPERRNKWHCSMPASYWSAHNTLGIFIGTWCISHTQVASDHHMVATNTGKALDYAVLSWSGSGLLVLAQAASLRNPVLAGGFSYSLCVTLKWACWAGWCVKLLDHFIAPTKGLIQLWALMSTRSMSVWCLSERRLTSRGCRDGNHGGTQGMDGMLAASTRTPTAQGHLACRRVGRAVWGGGPHLSLHHAPHHGGS